MKGALLFSIACLAFVAACRSDSSGSPFELGHSARPDSAPAMTLSQEEIRLLDELRTVYPTSQGELLVRALSDPFVIGAKAPQNARAQAILDKLDVIRNSRVASMSKMQAPSKASTVFPATVVLLPQLPDSTATAVVWRRTHLVPHDVIALRADRATLGALGAGVRVLTKLRREEGDSATKDEHIVVRGNHIPKHWKGVKRALATSELTQLVQSKSGPVAAFGNVRSRTIYFTPSKPIRPE